MRTVKAGRRIRQSPTGSGEASQDGPASVRPACSGEIHPALHQDRRAAVHGAIHRHIVPEPTGVGQRRPPHPAWPQPPQKIPLSHEHGQGIGVWRRAEGWSGAGAGAMWRVTMPKRRRRSGRGRRSSSLSRSARSSSKRPVARWGVARFKRQAAASSTVPPSETGWSPSRSRSYNSTTSGASSCMQRRRSRPRRCPASHRSVAVLGRDVDGAGVASKTTLSREAAVAHGLSPQLLDELAELAADKVRAGGLRLMGEGGLLVELTRHLMQAAVEAEMDRHLAEEAGRTGVRGSRSGGNARNGYRSRKVMDRASSPGPVSKSVPGTTRTAATGPLPVAVSAGPRRSPTTSPTARPAPRWTS